MGSGVRVHWDRVFVLLAIVSLLLVAVGHAVVRAVPDRAGEAAPGSAPDAAAAPSPCPAAAAGVVRTAPRADGGRTVALTFDDGPGPSTDAILAVLADHDVRATFFVVGQQVAAEPDLVRKMVAAGHAVENHSWSHPSAGGRQRWDPDLIGREIRRTSAEITAAAGRPPCAFRPPQGVVRGAKDQSRSAGLSIVLWSVDTRDWATHGADAAATIRSRARSGLTEPSPIVLLHDGGGDRSATVAALPGIIDDYRRGGFTFVTLADGRP